MSHREATTADIDRLMELEGLCFGPEAWTREMLEEELAGAGRRYLVSQEAGVVMGYGGVYLGLDSTEVMTVAIDPGYQRRGLGRRLMEALLAESRRAGSRWVTLEVAVGAEPAIGLYRSLGFEPIGRRQGYYQPSGRDAIIMRLET
ncbi:MAG: ribosomal protein S18-alanine N-acetyltransferase [Bifidobacteriaceae bacterium]|jgi:ribosomal-protein-alanine N-acetyltransferase|nr:ribosomal protein S18-alanine N-acetyltransferase [Bifidobacteriaceae bacterium]